MLRNVSNVHSINIQLDGRHDVPRDGRPDCVRCICKLHAISDLCSLGRLAHDAVAQQGGSFPPGIDSSSPGGFRIIFDSYHHGAFDRQSVVSRRVSVVSECLPERYVPDVLSHLCHVCDSHSDVGLFFVLLPPMLPGTVCIHG